MSPVAPAAVAEDPVRSGVVAFLPASRVLVVGGRDRLRFLQALVAQDLDGLVPGGAVYGALTDDRGRAIADYHLFVLPEAVLLELPAGRADEARAALDARVVADDVRTAWASGAPVAYESADPERVADAIAPARTGRFAPPAMIVGEPGPAVGYAPDGPAEDDPALEEEEALAAVPAARHAVLRASRLGGFGVLHWATGDRTGELAAAATAGAVTALSPTQLDPLEIACGRVGAAELAGSAVWNELGLMSGVSLAKGCWMGQEIVRRVHVKGETKRLLTGLVLETPHGVGWAGAALVDGEGAAAGTVTRAARLAEPAVTGALAFVRRDRLAPGTELVAVRGDGTRVAARLHALPFVRRRPANVAAPAWLPREDA